MIFSSRWISLYLRHPLYLHRLNVSTKWQDFKITSLCRREEGCFLGGLLIDHHADNFWKGEELGNSFSMLFLC